MWDAFAKFSDEQAVTDTAASTNHINLGSPDTVPGAPAPLKRDLGGGNNMPIKIMVTEDFATLTSLEASIEVDDNSSFSSAKTVGSTGAIPVADLVVGKILPLTCIPFGVNEQYMRLKYTVVGTTATAGAVSAGITTGVNTNG